MIVPSILCLLLAVGLVVLWFEVRTVKESHEKDFTDFLEKLDQLSTELTTKFDDIQAKVNSTESYARKSYGRLTLQSELLQAIDGTEQSLASAIPQLPIGRDQKKEILRQMGLLRSMVSHHRLVSPNENENS